MACFVSLSFSIPPCSLPNPLKVRYPKKSASCRLPGLGITKTASYFLALCCSNKTIYSVNGEHYLNTMSKPFDELVSCNLNASSSTRIVIMGYWVGPDDDDDWGFVEASICRSG
ncbi:hypothetical protein Gotri_019474 [Gossypium trilobum]|uniref:Uncharacterized protein n=1 Tax=Gossypium trilobum TaxID=34281 RepID=A0A7J9ED25_9ROSI|nr:hypothetical protein [Gossypium trilobum]